MLATASPPREPNTLATRRMWVRTRPRAGGSGFGNYTRCPAKTRFPFPSGPVPVVPGLATTRTRSRHSVTSRLYISPIGGGLTLSWRQGAILNGHWLDAAQQTTKLLRPVNGELQDIIRQHVLKVFQRNDCLRSIGAATREVPEAFVASW